MTKTIALITLFLLNGCTPCVKFSELSFRTSDATLILNNEPYTGSICEYYDDGGLSYSASVVNGVPQGSWESLGYSEEIIQHGEYIPVKSPVNLYEINGQFIPVNRINYISFHEGDYAMLYIDIVSSTQLENRSIIPPDWTLNLPDKLKNINFDTIHCTITQHEYFEQLTK